MSSARLILSEVDFSLFFFEGDLLIHGAFTAYG